SIANRAGGADTVHRPLTRTGSPRSSTTSAATDADTTEAGEGDGNRPGHGNVADSVIESRGDARSTAPAGINVTCSSGRRAPRLSGTATASGPTSPASRAMART